MAQVQGREVAGDEYLEKPGDFCFAGADFLSGHALRNRSEYRSMLFRCPECGSQHGVPLAPHGNPGWHWDGNVERPTLTPSIQILGHGKPGTENCRWHGYLTAGVWIGV